MSRNFVSANYTSVAIGVNAISSRLAGAGAISWFAWVRPTVAGTSVLFDWIITGASTRGGVYLLTASGSNVVLQSLNYGANGESQSTLTGSAAMPVNQWSAMGCVFSMRDKYIKHYINGLSAGFLNVASTAIANAYTPGTPSGSDMIGRSVLSTTRASAMMGHIALWRREVSQQEYRDMANGMSPLAICDGLVCYFPMQDPQGIHDVFNGLQGTITGSVPLDEDPRGLWMPSTSLTPPRNLAKTVALLEAA